MVELFIKGDYKMGSDFRYNTGATKVPWAAVGENYNVHEDRKSVV